MTFVRPKARILELSTTSGSGPFALAGAPDNSYNTFSAFMAVGDQTYATVVEPGVAFWTGIITYSATNQITLTTVEETKGTFGAGTKEIFSDALASTSMFREDIAGAIVTGGTSTAYTVASYRKYTTLAVLDGNIIAFSPHAGNGQAPTLSVDGLAAKPLRLSPGVDIGSSVLIQGTPYTALYNNAAGVFYLHGLGGNAYGIPLAGSMDFWGPTAPSSALAFMYGQPISRATYAALFALLGTTYGVGDGSTTFNLPDLRGRVVAGKDDMGGSAASRLTSAYYGTSAAVLGAAGGAESKTLVTPNLPPYTPAGTITNGAISHNAASTATSSSFAGGGFPADNATPASISQAPSTFTGTAQGGTSAAFAIAQPTIIANKLLRVI